MPTLVRAVFPGTFDPITLGHEDMLRRACALFGEVIVAVAMAHHKKTLFTLDELRGVRALVVDKDHRPRWNPSTVEAVTPAMIEACITTLMQGRLFEAFFTTKPDGLGLGLSICKTIVEAHGGDLSASAPASGKGLVVRFSLPLADAGKRVAREPIR